MADSTPAVQTELTAALAALVPQIKGLQGLAAAGVSADLATALTGEAEVQIERQTLIHAVMTAIAALQANGYPTVPQVNVPESLLAELQEEQSAIASAVAMFSGVVAVIPDLANVTHEPQPRPKA